MDQTAPTVRRQELEASFLSNLPVIDSAIRIVARRNHLSEDERDEFAGEVRLAFVERDYDILARFQGASSLRTYLVTVIARQFSDYRRRLWGKWRLSAEAKRRGVVAERLEVLLYRDHVTLGEAIEILQTNLGVTQSREELVALAQALPPRVDRRPVSGDALTGVAAGELASPEVQVEGDQNGEPHPDAGRRSAGEADRPGPPHPPHALRGQHLVGGHRAAPEAGRQEALPEDGSAARVAAEGAGDAGTGLDDHPADDRTGPVPPPAPRAAG